MNHAVGEVVLSKNKGEISYDTALYNINIMPLFGERKYNGKG
jgi:hypothetical protein